MTEDYFDASPEVEELYGGDSADPNTFIRVNGSNMSLTPGTSFITAVKDAARNADMGKFRVYLNGSEIKPSQAPETIAEGSQIELRPYDVAG